MTQSTTSKSKSSILFAVGIVAAFVGARARVPLGLAIAVTMLVFAIHTRKLRSWPVLGSAALVVVMSLMTVGYVLALHSSASTKAAETTRVHEAFQRMSMVLAHQDGVPPVELTPVRAGVASFPDGTKASLWVADAATIGIRSHCLYVDESLKGGFSGYRESACGVPGIDVTLERQGSLVTGYIGLTPADTVLVNVNGLPTRISVTFGYFILPGALSTDSNAKFTITLMSKTGESLGTVTDLMAPGSATPR